MRKLIIIRADGNQSIGMGHLIRELEIAKEFQKAEYEVVFLTKDYEESITFLSKNNCKFFKLNKDKQDLISSIEEIDNVLKNYEKEFNIIVVDILEYFHNQEYLNCLKKFCQKLIVITDETKPFYIDVDIVFALSQHQKPRFYKNIKSTKYYPGLKYFPLNKNFQNIGKKIIKKNVLKILLSFGGSDPRNYSGRIIEILKSLKLDMKITLLIGPGFSKKIYQKLIKEIPSEITIEKNVKDIFNYFYTTDLCICSAGNTLIELLTCGVPCIVLPQTKRENDHSIGFEQKKMILNLGLDFKDEDLILKLKRLINDYSLRKQFSKNAQKYLDGKGLNRIIDIILKKK